MRNLRPLLLASALVIAGGLTVALGCSNRALEDESAAADFVAGSDLVISQVFGAGGTIRAPYSHDFVELFNRGKAPINLAGKSLQYASSAGAFKSDDSILALPDVTLEPGRYFLIQLRGGDRGEALPTPDFAPDGAFGLSKESGKLALVLSDAPLTCSSMPCEGWIDLVGYGRASLAERSATPKTDNETGVIRKGQGCEDTNDNEADFEVAAPLPRNSASPPTTCVSAVDGGAVDPDAAATDGGAAPEAGAEGEDGGVAADGGGTNEDPGAAEADSGTGTGADGTDPGEPYEPKPPSEPPTEDIEDDPAPDAEEKAEMEDRAPGSGSSNRPSKDADKLSSSTSGSAKSSAKSDSSDSSGCSASPARTPAGGAPLTLGVLGVALASLVRRRRRAS